MDGILKPENIIWRLEWSIPFSDRQHECYRANIHNLQKDVITPTAGAAQVVYSIDGYRNPFPTCQALCAAWNQLKAQEPAADPKESAIILIMKL